MIRLCTKNDDVLSSEGSHYLNFFLNIPSTLLALSSKFVQLPVCPVRVPQMATVRLKIVGSVIVTRIVTKIRSSVA